MFKFNSIFFSLIFACFCTTNACQSEFVYIFAHGLYGNKNHIQRYIDTGVIMQSKNCTCFSDDFCDATYWRNNIYLGQETDIAILDGQIKAAYEKNKDCKIVVVGVSKGAATVINAVGKIAYDKSEYLKNIVAIVIESSPEDFNDVVLERFLPYTAEWTLRNTKTQALVKYAVRKVVFPDYAPDGIQPIKSINVRWIDVPKEMVIVLIHSKQDTYINIRHSKIIYDALKDKGFNNLYFIEADQGKHANLFWGPSQAEVLKKLWSIYKRHNLPLPNILHASPKAIELLSQVETEYFNIATSLQPPLFRDQIVPRKMCLTEKICWGGIIASTVFLVGSCVAFKKYRPKKAKLAGQPV